MTGLTCVLALASQKFDVGLNLTMGKLCNFSKPQFLQLDEGNKSAHIVALMIKDHEYKRHIVSPY